MKYLSFRSLGTIADTCSQIQQYASLYAVAVENNAVIVLPESTMNDGHGVKLFNLLDIPHVCKPDDFFREFESFEIDTNKQVDERIFNLPEGSFFIDGRFDLYTYWYDKHKNTVFDWPIHSNLMKEATEYIESIKKSYGTDHLVSLHIRLGDYLLPQHHHFVKLWKTNYYQDAIELAKSDNSLFLVFTNDVNWCKENLLDEDTVFVNTGNDYLDFAIMSMCNNNIIANSSYSWWAAFKNRNENKKVICPKKYLLDYSAFKHINGNWYPSDWVSIDIQGG
jgi:hypothetical protein